MKTSLILLSSLCLLSVSALHADESNTLTDAEKAEGWTLLFDGKDLSKWRNFKKEDLSGKWQVADGAFTLTEKGGGDIITKDTYGAFELKLDYKITKAGNSGLMYHVTEEEATPWRTGPEIQIQDNIDGHDPQKAGWLYQLYPAETDATKPVGEWNTLHILITPEKCVHYMNGTKYCEYVKGSADWDAKVAASKFSAFEKFGKATEGHICLQDHGDVVSFRNVRIRKID
ncbi:MAG TPA: DUF1080 domain-containing protein [Bacteroidia bacterium]|nr:DUF1080 domain-containing protein [Bacteroidia bacterium]